MKQLRKIEDRLARLERDGMDRLVLAYEGRHRMQEYLASAAAQSNMQWLTATILLRRYERQIDLAEAMLLEERGH